MSGGVDSSAAAALLLEQGYDVQGLFMSNWAEDEDGYCTTAADFQDARRVAELLGITLHRIDFSQQYRERVFRHFLDEYAAGRTPNPDVLCNREIKFGVCFEYAQRLGADLFATGHYARLERTRFPLGTLAKSEVRRIARDRALPVHDKKDSTGICFIGERPFARFLEQYLPARPGPIVDEAGACVGRHRGLMFYTFGQRKGLGIGGRRDAGEAPWYVIGKDLERNELQVSQHREHPRLMSQELLGVQVSWIGEPPAGTLRCAAKTRYRQPDQSCLVEPLGHDRVRVEFDLPQWAVTPGQYVVFYLNEQCLGGGVIATTEAAAQSTAQRCGHGSAAAYRLSG
jgi:tRNA-specific 2-thiouridylase